MISITRFNGTIVYLNADLIQSVEGTPDTVITLTNNVKIVVRERPQEVINKIVAYQRLVHNPQLEITSGD
ncbi:MAG: flagellar FlbD family protein [Anaerolineales bacterium]|nr:flagellar FlbD family protein [Anaerolineales bacterium]